MTLFLGLAAAYLFGMGMGMGMHLQKRRVVAILRREAVRRDSPDVARVVETIRRDT